MRAKPSAFVGALLLGVALGACTPSGISTPFSEPQAAVIDGQVISMKDYQARLQVSRDRDPYLGIPEAIPTPVSSQRLEDFTIEQLVREQLIVQEAGQKKISITDRAVQARIDALKSRAGAAAFSAALERNGFSLENFKAYQRVLLAEVALIESMARDRAASAAGDLKAAATFNATVQKWSDDAGTLARNGEVGWLRPNELPEAQLATAVQSLATGAISDVVRTDRGFVIANVLGRRNDQVHLAVILVLAPSVDLISAQSTPSWFAKFIDDRESALQRAGKIVFKVGSHAR